MEIFSTHDNVNTQGEYAVNTNVCEYKPKSHAEAGRTNQSKALHYVRKSLINLLPRCT